ncbi:MULTISPECIES: helix-turn-helix domain-containing protein [Burkholderia]|uniref:helix-turn-helix domain-containing protein n=1 Tax=Burkholderia TaxID=32008 RepID=UPI000876FA4B|nr:MULTISPECIES: helix-turn-helix domain-containing protein [Burkholderia]TCT31921.1 Nlp family transcriptional regulator [Burkholderia vietnamiensis]SCZ28262.1 transcriptional regulator, Nlp family [Burkholderia vietnamiensis]SFX63883.1 transcriptional regulator, Nlp family [Burkholderia vietnamiensis]HDR9256379.1 helix-turn-helix domain-containing protein [Burkholderia vietnamiensis]
MHTPVLQKKSAKDWDKADIKCALEKKGWNILRLAKASGYTNASALRKAFDSSYPKAERIIAHAIGVEPETIWPSRYEKRNFTPVLSPSSPVCVPRRDLSVAVAMD